MARKVDIYYQIDECHFSEECSAQALKRACPWQTSIRACKDAYRQHLDNCSHHANRIEKEKQVAMEAVEVLEKEWTDQPNAKKVAYDNWA